jgi:hypothetical protein
MSSDQRGKEKISFIAIKTSLGLGGSFLSAAFILQVYLERGFFIPAAMVTFVLVALIVRAFAGMRLPIFSLATLIWLLFLYLLLQYLLLPSSGA